MQRLDKCPICGSDSLKVWGGIGLNPTLHTDLFGIKGIRLGVMSTYDECQACTIVFQNPCPTEQEVNHFYSSGEYRKSIGISESAQDRDEMERADRVAGWLSCLDNPTSHLDIGFSRGHLLRAVGAERMCGLDIMTDYYPDDNNIQATPEVGERFDLVTCVHTLEHMYRPLNVLNTMYGRLNPNGWLYIEVPGEHTTGGPLRFAHLYYIRPLAMSNLVDMLPFNIRFYNIEDVALDIGLLIQRRK